MLRFRHLRFLLACTVSVKMSRQFATQHLANHIKLANTLIRNEKSTHLLSAYLIFVKDARHGVSVKIFASPLIILSFLFWFLKIYLCKNILGQNEKSTRLLFANHMILSFLFWLIYSCKKYLGMEWVCFNFNFNLASFGQFQVFIVFSWVAAGCNFHVMCDNLTNNGRCIQSQRNRKYESQSWIF